MRTISLRLGAAVAALSIPGSVFAQVPLNSRFFSVEGYYYPDQTTGDFRPYRVAGFASPQHTGNPARLIILPTIYLEEASVRVFDAAGRRIEPWSSARAQSITVEPRMTNANPTPLQMPAIGASLAGVTLRQFLPPPLLNTANQPYTFEGWTSPPSVYLWPVMYNTITAHYHGYNTALVAQNNYAASYSSYAPQQANLSELRVALFIDNEAVAVRTFPGNSASPSTLPSITLVNPSEVQQNKLKSGDYEVQASYGFRDVSFSNVTARFNAHTIISQLLTETREAKTKNTSSGAKILGFGTRRTKVRSSVNEQIRSQVSVSQIQGTEISMYDATEDMIKRFEDAFLPRMSVEDVIQEHRTAARVARDANNPNLAQVHERYADALAASNELGEVDMEKAAAALTAQDWAGFLAHGVRAGSNNDRRENEFRRVISNREEIDRQVGWSETQQVTLQRETTVTVRPQRTQQTPAYWGICGSVPQPFTAWVNTFGGLAPVQREGVLITCVQAGSPAALANLVPGRIVTRLGHRTIGTLSDWQALVGEYEPGDEVDVYVFHHIYPMTVSEERPLRLRLRRGVPAPPGEQG